MFRTAAFAACFCLGAAPAALAASLVLAPNASDSVTLPPDVFSAPAFVPVDTMPAQKVTMGKLAIVLEKTKLSDVAEKIGTGRVQTARGGNWDGEILLCYTVIRADGAARIWLTSNFSYGAASGADDSRVLGIVATELTGTIAVPRDCPMLPQKFQPVTLNGNVQIGMSADDALHRLAPKVKVDSSEVRFDYDSPVKGNDPAVKLTKGLKDFRVGSNLTVKIADGRIVTFSAERITSN